MAPTLAATPTSLSAGPAWTSLQTTPLNKLVPCAQLSSIALEVWRLRFIFIWMDAQIYSAMQQYGWRQVGPTCGLKSFSFVIYMSFSQPACSDVCVYVLTCVCQYMCMYQVCLCA